MRILTRVVVLPLALMVLASPIRAQQSLALVYLTSGKEAYQNGRYDEAVQLMKLALKEAVKITDPKVLFVVTVESVNGLSVSRRKQRRFGEAEGFLRSLVEFLETNDPTIDDAEELRIALHNLGLTLREQDKRTEAEAVHRRALVLREQLDNHSNVAVSLINLGALYFDEVRYTEAEALFTRAANIFRSEIKDPSSEKVIEERRDDLLNWALCQQDIAAIYLNQRRNYGEAKSMLTNAIQLRELAQGHRHPDLILPLELYARALRALRLNKEAALVDARVRKLKVFASSG